MGLALSIAHDGISKDLGREGTLESRVAIEAFLREVETRAFRIAVMNVRDRDEALDIVQDCMIRLVRRYSRRPSEEWRPLFYRILQNRIRDVQRRRSVRSRVLSFFGGVESDESTTRSSRRRVPKRTIRSTRCLRRTRCSALEQALLDAAGAPARGVHVAQLRGTRRRADRGRDEVHGRKREDSLLARGAPTARAAQRAWRGALV